MQQHGYCSLPVESIREDTRQSVNGTKHTAHHIRGRWQIPRYPITLLLDFLHQYSISVRYYSPIHFYDNELHTNRTRTITDIEQIRSLWHDKHANYSIPPIIHQTWKTANIASHSAHSEAAAVSLSHYASGK